MGMGKSLTTNITRYRGHARSVGIGGAAALIAMVMALAPVSQGALLHAPYHGTATEELFNEYFGCKAKSTIAVKPAFSLVTGAGKYSGSGSVKSCAGPVAHIANGLSENGGGPLAELPVSLANGVNNVSLSMAGSWASSGSISYPLSNTCAATYSYNYYLNSTYFYYYHFGSCEVLAEYVVEMEALVFDGTNNTWYYPTGGSVFGAFPLYAFNESYNFTNIDWGCYDYNYASPVCYSYNSSSSSATTSWSNSMSTTGTGWVNITGAVGSHHYYVVLDGVMEIFNYITEFSGATAKSTLNMGTLGNGYSVTSIVT